MKRGSQHYKELRDKLDPHSTTVIKADSELGKKYGVFDKNKFNQIPEEVIQKDIERYKNNPETPYSFKDYKEYGKLLNPKWDDETNLVANMPKYKYKYALKHNIKLDYYSHSKSKSYSTPSILESDLYSKYDSEYKNCLKNLAHIEESSLQAYLFHLEKRNKLDSQIANIYDNLPEQTKSFELEDFYQSAQSLSIVRNKKLLELVLKNGDLRIRNYGQPRDVKIDEIKEELNRISSMNSSMVSWSDFIPTRLEGSEKLELLMEVSSVYQSILGLQKGGLNFNPQALPDEIKDLMELPLSIEIEKINTILERE
jgi:hypothetical protein